VTVRTGSLGHRVGGVLPHRPSPTRCVTQTSRPVRRACRHGPSSCPYWASSSCDAPLPTLATVSGRPCRSRVIPQPALRGTRSAAACASDCRNPSSVPVSSNNPVTSTAPVPASFMIPSRPGRTPQVRVSATDVPPRDRRDSARRGWHQRDRMTRLQREASGNSCPGGRPATVLCPQRASPRFFQRVPFDSRGNRIAAGKWEMGRCSEQHRRGRRRRPGPPISKWRQSPQDRVLFVGP